MQKIKINIKRAATTMTCICLCFIMLVVMVLHNSAVISGVNSELDDIKVKYENAEVLKKTVEGAFLDRNNNPITVAEKAGVPAKIQYGESFSHLIGFNSAIYGLSGLRSRFSEDLFDGGKDGVGAQIKLTVDAELQHYCYDILNGNEGSCVVLDSKSGEVLALASRSSAKTGYEANLIDEKYSTYSKIDSFFYDRSITAFDPPGSTFKMVTAVSLYQNNMADITYNDKGVYKTAKAEYHNFGENKYGKINLETAMKRSSNTYFCYVTNRLGANALIKTAKGFMYNEAVKLDFCTLNSNFELSNFEDEDLLVQTGFGQGKTLVSPLFLAMQIGAIQNNGALIRPYVVSSVVNDDKIKYAAGKAFVLNNVGDKKAIAPVYDILCKTANSYGFKSTEDIKIIAKTGTAELPNDKHTVYMTLGLCILDGKESREYAICLSLRNVESSSSILKDRTKILMDYMIDEYKK